MHGQLDSQIDQDARIVLDYMRLDMEIKPSDIIVGLGCLDIRVAEHSAQLFLDGYGKLLIFTGATGRITKDYNTQTEAETFRDVAISMGVPENKILLETNATNTGANIVMTEQLLDQERIAPKSIIFVTKPYMERRLYATYKKQWRKQSIAAYITSPQLSYEEHFAPGTISKKLFLNVMVSDLQRMKEYSRLGFQVEQHIPDNVWLAYKRLIAAGYTQQLAQPK